MEVVLSEATNVQSETGVKMSVQEGEMRVLINNGHSNNGINNRDISFSLSPKTDPIDIKFENVKYTATSGGILGYNSGTK